MADRPLVEFCRSSGARMENRSVLQWDKDDLRGAGLVKFDLLGLGMLTMLHLAVDLIEEHEGVEIDLATIPRSPRSRAVVRGRHRRRVPGQSRAQMATLPRVGDARCAPQDGPSDRPAGYGAASPPITALVNERSRRARRDRPAACIWARLSTWNRRRCRRANSS